MVSSSLFPVSDTSAQTISVENRATGYFITVDAPSSASIEVTPTTSGSTAVSAASSINVVTNAPGGYKLYLSATNVNLSASGVTPTFVPTSSTSLSDNSWGYSLDQSTWNAVTTSQTQIAQNSSSNYPSGTNTDVYYGIKADTSMPAATYSTTVTYTAVAEGIPEQYTMQGFTIAQCTAMNADESIILMDMRDGKNYRVVKARDGNCWMADNLSIYNTTLDSFTTNLEEGTTFTLPDTSNWDTNDYSQPLVHVATTPGYEGEVYYNWCSAVALTGDDCATTARQQYNICPKGWTLPVNGTATTDKSYAKLFNSYGITTGEELLAQSSLGFNYYGYWNYASHSEVDGPNFSYFWYKNANDNADSSSAALYYDPSNIYIGYNYYKSFGLTMRCVFENRTMADIANMQDMTTEICNNTAEGYSKTLVDKRGTGNAGGTAGGYGVIKAKDGNCWMTDNLNLYNKTVSATDSDLKTGSFTIPASSNWNTNDYTQPLVHIGVASGYVGENYYNWCSAAAKTSCAEASGTAPESICPKGFRLPISGNASQNKSWFRLTNAYGVISGSQLLDVSHESHVLGFTKYYGDWNYSLNAEGYQGYYGLFWTGMAYSTNLAYYMQYDNSSIGAQGADSKGNGFSVRCVSR